jgi:signal transduction histidine kinase/ActR/RegA family two-component response regulator
MSATVQSENASLAAAVRAEQIRTLYRQSVGLSLVNPVNAAIVAAALWPAPRPELLLGWVIAMTVVAIGRVVLRHRYLRAQPSSEHTSLWARRFVIGATTSGALWGIAAAAFYDSHLVSALLIIFAIGGMVAGATGTLALNLPSFFGFVISAILPTVVRLLTDEGPLHLAMGALAIIYGVAMTLVALNTHRAVSEAFRLRFENQSLLEQLSRAQVSLADANRTLEERVAERGLALEKQTEALRDAQRMESIGLLAGGVAHDFNNLLTVVLGNVELLHNGIHLFDSDRRALDDIQRAAQRGAALVGQLLAFSRRQVLVPQILDLNSVVSEVLPLLARLIEEHIELIASLHSAPLPVKADAIQLQQVIINLVTNARDAMPAGGKLIIETSLVENTTPGSATSPGRYAVLSVRDTGIGMDAETKRKAFDPFFTTKDIGRGTGLGLATVHEIVKQSSGHVSVESQPGKGSCFRVFLPWVSADVSAPTGPEPTTGSPAIRTGVTVLIAEDEPSVRELALRTLSTARITVIQAENGERALEVVRHHKERIDLLISDVVMPKLGGVELANVLALEKPNLRILLVSGYSCNDTVPPGAPSNIKGFLQKPFTPMELLETVSKILAMKKSVGARSE